MMPTTSSPSLASFNWGWAGVDLFFVLSGFLITGILYDSLGADNFFRGFYIRRSLRIFPLYFGFWLLLVAATPILHVHWNAYIVSMALYVGNLFIPGADLHQHANPALIPIGGYLIGVGHLWSLCVEEQFYLIWPAVVWFVRKRSALIMVCVGYALAVAVARTALLLAHPAVLQSHALYLMTPFRLDSLLLG